jgi:hypothetical protein
MARKKSATSSVASARDRKAMAIGKAMAEAALKRREADARARRRALAKNKSTVSRTIEISGRTGVRASRITRTSAGVLVAEGDSWFDYPFYDVLGDLENLGYDVESVAHRGDTVEGMAYTDQLDDFSRTVEKALSSGLPLKAILLSGGGNDIAGDHFEMLLNHAASASPGLNAAVVDGVIRRIHDSYVTILHAITTICRNRIGRTVPILVHGYDYSVPDGRGYLGGWWLLPGPWLKPGFDQKGYGRDAGQRMVKQLIDRFNDMLAGIAGSAPFAHVRHIDLRRTLSSGADYKTWWGNELHPTKRGFSAVTNKFVAAL